LASAIKILDTWKVHGMRGTGSQDVLLENVFVPDAAMGGVRRAVGRWHPFMHVVSLAALPVFYAAYLGVAESARDLALKLAARKKDDPLVPLVVGEMENQVVTAQLAHASMVQMVITEKPGPATTSAVMSRRTILATAAVRTVETGRQLLGLAIDG
jgi:acyl-CoA dehydrogenase